MLYPGSETRTPEPSSREPARGVQIASAEPGGIVPGSGIEMNFEGTDIQTVAKTLLGDLYRHDLYQIALAHDGRVRHPHHAFEHR